MVMAPMRQVCHRQLEILIEFAEQNRAIALSNTGKGPLGQQEANRGWEEVARRLNSIGGGVIKTPANWKRYWHLLKCRAKAKAADLKKSHGGTGGGPNKTVPLTEIEERIIAIIGKVAVEGVAQVRIPFDLTETQPSSSHQNSALAMEMEQNIEVELVPDEMFDLESFSATASGSAPATNDDHSYATHPVSSFEKRFFGPSDTTVSGSTCGPVAVADSELEFIASTSFARASHPATGTARRAMAVADFTRETVAVTGSAGGPIAVAGSARELVVATGSARATHAATGSALEPVAVAGSAREPVVATGSARTPTGSARGPVAGAAVTSPASAASPAPLRNPRRRPNRDENLPGWAYELEERRINVEDGIRGELSNISATNRGILECLQRLVQILEAQMSPT